MGTSFVASTTDWGTARHSAAFSQGTGRARQTRRSPTAARTRPGLEPVVHASTPQPRSRAQRLQPSWRSENWLAMGETGEREAGNAARTTARSAGFETWVDSGGSRVRKDTNT